MFIIVCLMLTLQQIFTSQFLFYESDNVFVVQNIPMLQLPVNNIFKDCKVSGSTVVIFIVYVTFGLANGLYK